MKKGMSLVELIVSFTIISLLSLVVFRTILNIQSTQIRNIAYNNFLSFHLTLNKQIQEDLVRKTITEISDCGDNCYNIRYVWQENGVNKQQIKTFKQNGDIISYHDYAEKLPKTFYLGENIKVSVLDLNNTGSSSFNKLLLIDIPLKSSTLERNTNIRYIYQYNNNSKPITISSNKILKWSAFETEGTYLTLNNTYDDSMGLTIEGKSVQGGIPTPTNPIEIKSVNNPKIVVEGKNLFDYQTMLFSNSTKEDDVISFKPKIYDRILGKTAWIPEQNHNYTLVFDITENTFDSVISIKADNRFFLNTFNKTVPLNFTGRFVINVSSRDNYDNVTLGSIWINTPNTVDGVFKTKLMILSGTYTLNEVGTYRKYQGNQNFTFPYELRSLPNGVSDYIEIDNINKTATLVRKTAVKVFNGTESWIKYTSNPNSNVFYTNVFIGNKLAYQTSICSHFKNVNSAWGGGTERYGWYSDHTSAINRKYFNFGDMFETVAEVQSWLTAQYNAGNPVTVLYELAESTTTSLNYNEIRTYFDTTNIYSISIIKPNLKAKLNIMDN